MPQVDVPAISACFMLSNMFDPTNETEMGWESDIKDDVLDECNKFGDVLHIHVDPTSPQVGVVTIGGGDVIMMSLHCNTINAG